jgi:hypothetical protein
MSNEGDLEAGRNVPARQDYSKLLISKDFRTLDSTLGSILGVAIDVCANEIG